MASSFHDFWKTQGHRLPRYRCAGNSRRTAGFLQLECFYKHYEGPALARLACAASAQAQSNMEGLDDSYPPGYRLRWIHLFYFFAILLAFRCLPDYRMVRPGTNHLAASCLYDEVTASSNHFSLFNHYHGRCLLFGYPFLLQFKISRGIVVFTADIWVRDFYYADRDDCHSFFHSETEYL